MAHIKDYFFLQTEEKFSEIIRVVPIAIMGHHTLNLKGLNIKRTFTRLNITCFVILYVCDTLRL